MTTAIETRAELAESILNNLDSLHDLAVILSASCHADLMIDDQHTPRHPVYAAYHLDMLNLRSFMSVFVDNLETIMEQVKELVSAPVLAA